MRRMRLFEELFDMQAETNRFFEDVYRRLVLFERAIDRWSTISDDAAFERDMTRFTRSQPSQALAPSPPPQITVSRASETRDAHPVALDMYDSDDEVVAEISIPGLHPGDLVISASEHRLTLQGKFSQTITLPEGVDADRIRAQYQNGVLRLALPKPPAASKTVPIDFR
jgi:HSP20 family molecular chaperone IbpA